MNENHPTHVLFYSVNDPQSPLKDCPALTTMLHRVCGNDQMKFEEACRLVGLFMEAAYDKGKADGSAVHSLPAS